jgi:hypothetical protein
MAEQDLPPGLKPIEDSGLPPGLQPIADKPAQEPVKIKENIYAKAKSTTTGGPKVKLSSIGVDRIKEDVTDAAKKLYETAEGYRKEFVQNPLKAQLNLGIGAAKRVPAFGQRLVELPLGLYSLYDPEVGGAAINQIREERGWDQGYFDPQGKSQEAGAMVGDVGIGAIESMAPVTRAATPFQRLIAMTVPAVVRGAGQQAGAASSIDIDGETPEDKAQRVRWGATVRGVSELLQNSLPYGGALKKGLTVPGAIAAESYALHKMNQYAGEVSGVPTDESYLATLGNVLGGHLAGKVVEASRPAPKFDPRLVAPEANVQGVTYGRDVWAPQLQRQTITGHGQAEQAQLNGLVQRVHEAHTPEAIADTTVYLSQVESGQAPKPSPQVQAVLNDRHFMELFNTYRMRTEQDLTPRVVSEGLPEDAPVPGRGGVLGRASHEGQKERTMMVAQGMDQDHLGGGTGRVAVEMTGASDALIWESGQVTGALKKGDDGQWYKVGHKGADIEPAKPAGPDTVDEALGIGALPAMEDPYASPQTKPIVGGGKPAGPMTNIVDGAVRGPSQEFDANAGVGDRLPAAEDVYSNPQASFKPSGIPGERFRMLQGDIPTLEANTPFRYSRDLPTVLAKRILGEGEVARTRQMEDLIRANENVSKPIDSAPEDWVHPDQGAYPGLKGQKVSPEFNDVLEAWKKERNGGNQLEFLKKANGWALKAGFQVNPTAHWMNMQSHFIKTLMGDPASIRFLPEAMNRAVEMERSIRMGQPNADALEYLRANGQMLSGSGGKEYIKPLGDSISALTGRDGTDLPKNTDLSERMTWRPDDRLRMTLAMARKLQGVDMAKAVADVNQSYPDYRPMIKPTGNKALDTVLDGLINNPAFVFQRYRRGAYGSAAKTIKDIAEIRNLGRSSEASAKVISGLGKTAGVALNFAAIKYLMTPVVQSFTQDERDQKAPGGTEHILTDLASTAKEGTNLNAYKRLLAKNVNLAPGINALAETVGFGNTAGNPEDMASVLGANAPKTRQDAALSLLRRGAELTGGSALASVTGQGFDGGVDPTFLLGKKRDYTPAERLASDLLGERPVPSGHDLRQRAVRKALAEGRDVDAMDISKADIEAAKKAIKGKVLGREAQLADRAQGMPIRQVALIANKANDAEKPFLLKLMAQKLRKASKASASDRQAAMLEIMEILKPEDIQKVVGYADIQEPDQERE